MIEGGRSHVCIAHKQQGAQRAASCLINLFNLQQGMAGGLPKDRGEASTVTGPGNLPPRHTH